MESEWNALKSRACQGRGAAGNGACSCCRENCVAVQYKGSLSRRAVSLESLPALPSVCRLVVSGALLFKERLTFGERGSLEVPNALSYLPNNFRCAVLRPDDAVGDVGKIYTMSLRNSHVAVPENSHSCSWTWCSLLHLEMRPRPVKCHCMSAPDV